MILSARRLDKLEPIAKSVSAIAVKCDIKSEEDIAALAERAVKTYGHLDAAINFAGINSSAPILEVTRQALMEACEVYFVGAALFFKHMAASGSLITTSSLTALVAPAGLAAYAGSKRGADHFANCSRRAWRTWNSRQLDRTWVHAIGDDRRLFRNSHIGKRVSA